ncbi:MAG: prolyl oligopeptidase family serine peptidase [Acidimicrobiia bacterium]
MTLLTAERLWEIPRVGGPHSLPDGRLLVPVTTFDPDTDESTTTLWRIGPDAGDLRSFASGSISGFAVAADGSAVAYLGKVADHRQVFVQPLDGGEARQVGELPLGAVGVKWVPTGGLVAMATVLADHPSLEETAAYEPDERLTARSTESAVYRYWDTWLTHVYHPVALDLATGQATDLTPGSTRFWAFPNTGDTIAELDISPDGTQIAFVADDSDPPHRQLTWSLFLMSIDGSGLRRLDEHRPGNSHHPRFTVGGAGLVYGYQAEPDFYAAHMQLIRYDLATGEERELAQGWDRSAQDWIFDGEGRLLFTAEDEGRSRLWRLASVDGEVQPLTEGGWVSDPTVAADGTVHVLVQSLAAPPEVHRVGAPDANGIHHLERTTTFTAAGMDGIELGAVRELTVAGADHDPIQVWVIDPPEADPNERRSLVHMIHGGPHGVFGDTWHWRWNAQTVAAAGHRVAHVNFHGSTGWGEAFTASIHGAWGDLPFRDVEAVTDHLIGIGLVDEDRMAVTGGSYGGYLTAWITSQTSRYAAAVAHAAVTNLGGMYASDVTFGRQRAYGGEIWDNRSAVERWSPSAHAAGYSTPTLVIHGHRDERVPSTQGMELYGVLVAKGVAARLVSYPDENHWILSRTNSIHWYGEVLDWLERWL